MQSQLYNNIVLTLIIILSFSIQTTFAQKLIKFDDPSQSLQDRWEQAIDQVNETPVWIGYSIKRLMSKNSFIGCSHSNDYSPSLKDIILENVDIQTVKSKSSNSREFHWDDGESVEKEMKEVAILFRVEKASRNVEFKEISMSNLSLYFDLKGHSLYWLGAADYNDSINLLKNIYNQTDDCEVKEDLITAVGIHENNTNGYNFLKDVIFSEENDEVREQAVFWIAQHDNSKVLDLMKKIANEDDSEDVREKAVFGLYMIDSEESINELIELARNSKRMHIRKQAIFWLGQTASKKAVAALNDVVYDEDETEIQNQAVFALSQLNTDESIPSLIKVAKTHPNPEVRKKAIFWLGQTEDRRALDAIISFLKD